MIPKPLLRNCLLRFGRSTLSSASKFTLLLPCWLRKGRTAGNGVKESSPRTPQPSDPGVWHLIKNHRHKYVELKKNKTRPLGRWGSSPQESSGFPLLESHCTRANAWPTRGYSGTGLNCSVCSSLFCFRKKKHMYTGLRSKLFSLSLFTVQILSRSSINHPSATSGFPTQMRRESVLWCTKDLEIYLIWYFMDCKPLLHRSSIQDTGFYADWPLLRGLTQTCLFTVLLNAKVFVLTDHSKLHNSS